MRALSSIIATCLIFTLITSAKTAEAMQNNEFNPMFKSAVEANKVDEAKLYLELGANVNAVIFKDKDYHNAPALLYCALIEGYGWDYGPMITMLLNKDAQIDYKSDLFNKTAFGDAKKHAYRTRILDYINSSGNRSRQNLDEMLLTTARVGDLQNLKYLLRMGANIDAQDPKSKKTALMIACESSEKTEMVYALLDSGADTRLGDSNRKSALLLVNSYNKSAGEIKERIMAQMRAQVAGQQIAIPRAAPSRPLGEEKGGAGVAVQAGAQEDPHAKARKLEQENEELAKQLADARAAQATAAKQKAMSEQYEVEITEEKLRLERERERLAAQLARMQQAQASPQAAVELPTYGEACDELKTCAREVTTSDEASAAEPSGTTGDMDTASEEHSAGGKACEICTLLNSDTAQQCSMCGSAFPKNTRVSEEVPAATGEATQDQAQALLKECPECTFQIPIGDLDCSCCGTVFSAPEPSDDEKFSEFLDKHGLQSYQGQLVELGIDTINSLLGLEHAANALAKITFRSNDKREILKLIAQNRVERQAAERQLLLSSSPRDEIGDFLQFHGMSMHKNGLVKYGMSTLRLLIDAGEGDLIQGGFPQNKARLFLPALGRLRENFRERNAI